MSLDDLEDDDLISIGLDGDKPGKPNDDEEEIDEEDDDARPGDADGEAEEGDGSKSLSDRDRLRVSRRAEKQMKAELAAMKRELEAVKKQADTLTDTQLDRVVADFDSQFEAAENRLDQAQEDGDRDEIKAARRHLREIEDKRSRVREEVETYRARNKGAADQKAGDADPYATARAQAREFIEDNPWFDPNPQSTDPRSKAVRDMAIEIAQEDGIDPNDERHWKILNRRIRDRGLLKDASKAGKRAGSRPTAGGGNRSSSSGESPGRFAGDKQVAWQTALRNARDVGMDISDKAVVDELRANFRETYRGAN